LNGFVPGGYIGVDVFFVVSGFLIGGIVFNEIDSGTFSFANFYKRLIRRIAPVLVLTLLASYAASAILMRARNGSSGKMMCRTFWPVAHVAKGGVARARRRRGPAARDQCS
jgi:peptidoglycan/LPS O-acetylase OafA/YrhL